jgi:hypothetical protein
VIALVTRPPHQGLIVCRDHAGQIDVDPAALEEIPTDRVAFWGHRCIMCQFDPAPGRLCESEDCRKPLHPQWPAVYCSNECALEDL